MFSGVARTLALQKKDENFKNRPVKRKNFLATYLII
jgi:hypothetical protein